MWCCFCFMVHFLPRINSGEHNMLTVWLLCTISLTIHQHILVTHGRYGKNDTSDKLEILLHNLSERLIADVIFDFYHLSCWGQRGIYNPRITFSENQAGRDEQDLQRKKTVHVKVVLDYATMICGLLTSKFPNT